MAVITHSLLFTQVSGAAMAAVPELTSEAMAYYRSVGRLGPAIDTGFPVEGWSVLWAWRSDLPPDCPFQWQAGFQADLVWKLASHCKPSLGTYRHPDMAAAGASCRWQAGREGATGDPLAKSGFSEGEAQILTRLDIRSQGPPRELCAHPVLSHECQHKFASFQLF